MTEENKDRTSSLEQCWLRSHEEDASGVVVYRPPRYSFPPSRGRRGFELEKDGTFADIRLSSEDGSPGARGKWSLERGDVLVLKAPERPERRLRVLSCDRERLLVEDS